MKKQKKSQNLKLLEEENNKFTRELTHELNENPEFSLDVDPTNKYSMSDAQKTFVNGWRNMCLAFVQITVKFRSISGFKKPKSKIHINDIKF